jgi:hypothetical protein
MEFFGICFFNALHSIEEAAKYEARIHGAEFLVGLLPGLTLSVDQIL